MFLKSNSFALLQTNKRRIVSISGKHQFIIQDQSKKTEIITKGDNDALSGRKTTRHDREQDVISCETQVASELPRQNYAFKIPIDRNKVDAKVSSYLSNGLVARLIKMRFIKNMTRNGKYARFSAIMAVGNGNGSIGLAHAKSLDAGDAVNKATKMAMKSMQYYDLFQDRTLFHDDIVKFKASLLHLRPAAIGSGRRCHPAISEMCRCMGLRDISAKVHGSRHSLNVAFAFLLALKRQKTPEMVAKDTGMRIVDVLKVYQQGCEDLTQVLRAERYSTMSLKL